ncbi:MAG: hypothetical protein NC086_05160 [Alistipes sp.]|nr:hypothetical protein [Alistipes sp.]
MAVYILMKKIMYDDEKVIYKFGPNEKQMGIIEFDKKSGKFNVTERVNDGILSNKAYERWAAEKIVKLMYKEGGIFPDTTSVEK